ncbi:hypothetical protein ACWGB8_21225 [Kitasatospora sp. NPDC054939]
MGSGRLRGAVVAGAVAFGLAAAALAGGIGTAGWNGDYGDAYSAGAGTDHLDPGQASFGKFGEQGAQVVEAGRGQDLPHGDQGPQDLR